MNPKFDQIKYQNDYNKAKYDRISLMVPKGSKEDLKAHAQAKGKSLNEYLNDLIFQNLL